MIKVQFVHSSAHTAPSCIALPDLQFYVCGNQAAPFGIQVCRLLEIFLAFDRDQLELANGSELVALGP